MLIHFVPRAILVAHSWNSEFFRSHLISDITGERPGRATSVSGYIQSRAEGWADYTRVLLKKTILSWKICTRLIGCSVLTPISGSVNLPFDYFLHSNTKVAVVRRLWQWGNSQNVLRFPPDRKTTRISERRTSHPLANELVLCVKDDKSPSTGRKLSCQQRQTGEGLLYENQIIELWTLGSNSDLRCGHDWLSGGLSPSN